MKFEYLVDSRSRIHVFDPHIRCGNDHSSSILDFCSSDTDFAEDRPSYDRYPGDPGDADERRDVVGRDADERRDVAGRAAGESRRVVDRGAVDADCDVQQNDARLQDTRPKKKK